MECNAQAEGTSSQSNSYNAIRRYKCTIENEPKYVDGDAINNEDRKEGPVKIEDSKKARERESVAG